MASSGDYIAFRGWGEDDQQGIYAHSDGALRVVADLHTPVPRASGTFNGFEWVCVDGESVAFVGQGAGGQSGVYTTMDGWLDVVVDKGTPLPDGSGAFRYFSRPALSGNAVAFQGVFRDELWYQHHGIFVRYDGHLIKIIDTRDVLDGKTIDYLRISDEALSGKYLAFLAKFEDGSAGIFIAGIQVRQ